MKQERFLSNPDVLISMHVLNLSFGCVSATSEVSEMLSNAFEVFCKSLQ